MDGTAGLYDDLMKAQYGYPDYDDDDKNKGGAFTKQAAKKGQSVQEYINDIVVKAQDMSNAKAMVLESWVKHIIIQHGGISVDAGGHAT